MNTKNLLREEIENEIEELSKMTVGSDEYRSAVDGITKLVDRLIEMDKLESANQEKVDSRESELTERDFKEKQMEIDRKSRIFENGIKIGGIVLPLVVTVWGTFKTLEFEKTGTITTIMGRGFINKLLPKK